MIGNAPRSHITQVPGWETLAEQELLVKLAQDVPPYKDGWGSRIVELGSEYGMSASLFCYGADPLVFIHCVDLFPGNMKEQHRANLDAAGFAGREIIYYQGNSQQGVPHWGHSAQPGIDLLFIDADHSYAGVKGDIEAWTPFVKPGGRVAFHDCMCAANFHADHLYQFDIMRAVSEWFTANAKGWRTYAYVDSIMVFERTA